MPNTPSGQLSNILELLLQDLDITTTQQERAKSTYQAVGKWLSEDGSGLATYEPAIFPQGSIALGTTVKPLSGDEFDVDLVCELQPPKSLDPLKAKELVGTRLSEAERYKKILQEYDRCWGLDYAGEFHMDILPAIPASSSADTLKVPDSKLKDWILSDPKGYASWFEKISISFMQVLKAERQIEPLPTAIARTPLQRSVQALKRHRDIWFKGKQELAPRSIVLTTLAAKAYQGEALVMDALVGVVQRMKNMFEVKDRQLWLSNPTIEEENLLQDWQGNPSISRSFDEWMQSVARFAPLVEERGLHKISKALKPMLGESAVEMAFEKYAASIEEKRTSGTLRVSTSTGAVGSSGTPIKKTTFYGD